MEAKDTVMAREQLKEITFCRISGRYGRVAEAQAEISFKAGTREVVEWLKERQGNWCDECGTVIVIELEEWRAKLKEWGL